MVHVRLSSVGLSASLRIQGGSVRCAEEEDR